MKKFFFVALVATALFGACNKPGEVKVDANTLKTPSDTLSYALGVANGLSEEDILAVFDQFDIDSTEIKAFRRGLEAAVKAGEDELAYQVGYMQGIQVKLRNAQIEKMVFGHKKGEKAKYGERISPELVLLGIHDGGNNKSGLVAKNTLPTGEVLNDTVNKANAGMFLQSYIQQLASSHNEFLKKVKESGAKQLQGDVYYKVTNVGKGDKPSENAKAMVSIDLCDETGKVIDSMPAQEFPLSQLPGGDEVRNGAVVEVYIPSSQSQNGENSIQRLNVIAINDQAPAEDNAQ